MDGPFASRAFVLILGFVVDEVPLVEPTFSLAVGCQRLGHQRNDAGLFIARFDRGNDAALGFDMGLVTLEPSVSFGLSRVFSDNPPVKDIGSKYLTYGMTLGINLGNDD